MNTTIFSTLIFSVFLGTIVAAMALVAFLNHIPVATFFPF